MARSSRAMTTLLSRFNPSKKQSASLPRRKRSADVASPAKREETHEETHPAGRGGRDCAGAPGHRRQGADPVAGAAGRAEQHRSGLDQLADRPEHGLHGVRPAVRPRRGDEPAAADAGRRPDGGQRPPLDAAAAREPVVPRRRAGALARLHRLAEALDGARPGRRHAVAAARCDGGAGRPHHSCCG